MRTIMPFTAIPYGQQAIYISLSIGSTSPVYPHCSGCMCSVCVLTEQIYGGGPSSIILRTVMSIITFYFTIFHHRFSIYCLSAGQGLLVRPICRSLLMAFSQVLNLAGCFSSRISSSSFLLVFLPQNLLQLLLADARGGHIFF